MRNWMVQLRRKRGYSPADIASMTGASQILIRRVEAGDVTHPKIVDRLAHAYGMSVEERNSLVPAGYGYEVKKLREPTKKIPCTGNYEKMLLLNVEQFGGM